MIKRYKWIWTCHRRLERLARREAILPQALGAYHGPPTTAPRFQRLYVGGESPQPWWSGPDPGEQLRGAHPLIAEDRPTRRSKQMYCLMSGLLSSIKASLPWEYKLGGVGGRERRQEAVCKHKHDLSWIDSSTGIMKLLNSHAGKSWEGPLHAFSCLFCWNPHHL